MRLSHRLLLIAAVCLAAPAAAQVSIPALGTPVTENFDTLANTGTSSVVPPGWAFAESGTNANTVYTAGTGSATAGDTYSFGASGSVERAFGGLQSGSLNPTIGASFVNNTGATISALAIAYLGEQWRLGATGRVDRIDFQYSTTATSLTTGTWTDVDALDFTAPTTGPTVGALDGNLPANRTAVAFTIVGLNIPNGATFWIRWADFNPSGSDDGLAVDDFSLTADGAVPTNPSGVGAANPAVVSAGGMTLLTVAVTPGSGPVSTGLAVRANLAAIGGAASQSFFDDGTGGDATAGDNLFSFRATVGLGTTPGAISLPATITDAQARSGSATIALSVLWPPSPSLVVSQVYGGGGNAGAVYKNDFIELFNRGPVPVSVAGWSVQYASSAGTSWQVTPLTAALVQPGTYYLVQEAAGAGGTTPLPTPDASGTIAMSATNGKVALVSSTVALSGGCPVAATIVDLVGYGSSATCSETSPTPPLSNTTAAIRNGGGSIDTNNNLADFAVGAATPRNSTGLAPAGLFSANPASASPGETTLLSVAVTPGASPPSTTLAVSADLAPIGGLAAQPFYDDGTNGDASPGDNVFSFLATVGSVPAGSVTLTATISDDLGRSSLASASFGIEPPLSAIHDIQGPALVSPLTGQFVATRGVVTGRRLNGFYIQAPDAEADANPATSEGLFVFTGATPTALGLADLVKVTGTVQEFVPGADPYSPPTTELISPAFTVLSSGHPLPSPVSVTAADTDPAGALEQLERLEGMRVHVNALRVVAPTQGSVNEPNAEGSSNGVFYGVVDGVARPFREPGVQVGDPLPPGAPAGVPRFDSNPERLRVDSDALLTPVGVPGPTLEVTAGALVSDLTGPLDFAFRTWTILPEPAAPPLVSGLGAAVPVPAPSENEFTVAAFNLERFFDTTDDPAIGEPVLSPPAFSRRLDKSSLAIRNVMRTPDILGVEEIENLATLQALAAKLNADAVASGQPDPAYQAYLVEGNDVGGIDSGFLVKSARVSVVDVVQEGKTATYINPNTGLPELLNDRPPLVLRALVQGPVGSPLPVTVIVNHLRSLNGVESTTDSRVRAKRAAQAEFLASLIQARQAADPGERIVSVGDYNAFQFNDGYVDVIGTVKGTPTPATQVVQASPDLVSPDLTDLVDLVPPEQGYSYSFDGSAQTLDHVLANAALMKRYSRFHVARNDADFPETYRNDPTRPERLSDHDMPVAYFAFPGAPTLTLLGPNPMSVECCTSFTDPGATASDEDLGDITGSIVVTGSVDAHTVGTYILTYSVSNGFQTTTLTRTVEVADTTPPALVLNGANPLTVELGGAYLEPGASASDSCAGDLTAQIQISGTVDTSAVGTYAVTYSVSDGYNTIQATRTVHVVDTTPPSITTLSPSPDLLWPPDGRLVPVVVAVSASDLSGSPTCSITAVSASEPTEGPGSGQQSPDWLVSGPLALQLRAERDGRGAGRIYTITVTCRDASGNSASGACTVVVPHDQGVRAGGGR